MEKGTTVVKSWLMGLIVVAVVILCSGSPAISKEDNVGLTGLPELTAEELEWQNKHMIRVKKVKVNKLGLERINQYREKKGKKKLTKKDIPVAEDGREVVGIIGASDATDSSSDTQSMLETLPTYVDNSALKFFPPIRTQGSLPSCGTFSGTYYTMTYMHALARDLDAKSGGDTYRFSPKWTYNMVNGGAAVGSWYYWAYDIGKKHGVATWAEFPYDSDYRAWCMNPAVWRNAIDRRFDQYGYVANTHLDSGIEQVKQLLMNGYILNIPTYIYSWQYKTIGNDPATSDDDAFAGMRICYWVNGTEGYHAMTVVGYNDNIWVDVNGNGAVDAGEKGAFRIANSWGTGWGEAGFVWMAYDALKNPSAVTGGPDSGRIYGWSPSRAHWVTARNAYEPSLVAEFTLHHAKRNQIRMTLGVADPMDGTPTQTWIPNMIYGDGGAYAFDGTTTACDGTFYLDFTDVVPSGGDYQRYFLGVYDGVAGDSVTVKDYRIIDVVGGNTEIVCSQMPITGDAEQLYPFVEYNFDDGNMSPIAVAQATPMSGVVPLTVSFDASGSYDEDGSIASYSWDFGDGITATGVAVDHTFLSAGTYDVILTVTDNRTSANEDWLTIQVSPDPTKVLYVDAIDMTMQTKFKFFNAQATVNIRDIANNGFENATVTGEWSGLVTGSVSGVTNESGNVVFLSPKTKQDGSIYFTVTHVAAAGYSYDETLNNETQDSILTNEPVNQKPTASIAASQTTGVAPMLVPFDGSGSYDSDGQIVSYLWDFGDDRTSTLATEKILFDMPGTYEVTLTVTDDQGAIDSDTLTITVTNGDTQVVYVSGLSIEMVSDNGGDRAMATIRLSDMNGNAVSGAIVSGQWSGLVSGDVTGVTDQNGSVILSTKKTRGTGNITFTMMNVSAAGYIYDAGSNVVTSISVDVL